MIDAYRAKDLEYSGLSDHKQAGIIYGFRDVLPALYLAFQEESVLDGFDHAGEGILQDYIDQSGLRAKDIFLNLMGRTSFESSSADMLRLLSRLEPFDSEWRASLVQTALSSSSLEIRDAAIQAVENWEESELVVLLKQHKEKDDFLRDYAEQVVEDLEG